LNTATTIQPRRLLYFSPFWAGGLADYALAQAEAVAKIGIQVLFLTSKRNALLPAGCEVRPELGTLQDSPGRRISLVRKFHHARRMLSEFKALARTVLTEGFDRVLMASYAEYLSPLWAGPLRRLARRGTVFGAVIHDPVRDYVLGPLWWHRWSVATAYSFLREAFVHEAIDLDTVRPVPGLRTTVIPHGPLQFPQFNRSKEAAQRCREQARAELEIPPQAKVLLAFGHVRDGKNLDLAIRAMASAPEVYLIVAGKVSSTTQKPIEYYQAVAAETGVADRCRWLIEFIPSDRVGDLFATCDAVLLTYNSSFRSASGVLNAAVTYRRPCIASAGQGNLRSMVRKYNLGLFVEPDNCAAIEAGICQWLGGIPEPHWDAYASDNSWEQNAEIVCNKMWDNRP
jgi:glycosyltransferase involved in cell wall biosynthesis